MTPEEVSKLMSLTDMFQKELASLGMDVNQIKARLDALGKRVDAIQDSARPHGQSPWRLLLRYA